MFVMEKYLGNISKSKTLIWCLLGKGRSIKGESKGNFSFSELIDGVGFQCGGK